MISSVSINSFKSFPEIKLNLGQLTVLTGLNNSGKSTVIQAIRMCFCGTNGSPYIEGLGGYGELRSKFSDLNSNIEISVTRDDEEDEIVSLQIYPNAHSINRRAALPYFQYISADRYGPRVSLPLMNDDSILSVGAFGQYSAHFAQIFENAIINPNLRYPDLPSNTLRHQLVKWIGEISPGVKLDFDVAKRYDSSSLAVDGNRSTNSGYGISYTLPIILSLLSLTGDAGSDDSNEITTNWFKYINSFGSLLVIENPEAHLHPRGQTNMGKLIALAAAAGLQIVVETHSDHLLDGIRLAVKDSKGSLSGSDVKIKYFSKTDDEGTRVEDIELADDGKLSHWPEGFFDQYSINLRALSKRNG